MNRRLITGLAPGILAIGLLLAAVVYLLNGRIRGSNTPVVDGPFSSTATTHYTTRPVKRDEMKDSILPLPLPDEATNLQFAEYSEYAAAEQFIRFEAPPEVCRDYAKALLDDHNRQNPGSPVPATLTPVNVAGEGKAASSEMQTPWFVPESIPHGIEGGATGSHQPKIWVDPENGVFYYQNTD